MKHAKGKSNYQKKQVSANKQYDPKVADSKSKQQTDEFKMDKRDGPEKPEQYPQKITKI